MMKLSVVAGMLFLTIGCQGSVTGPDYHFAESMVADGVRFHDATTAVASDDPATLRTSVSATNLTDHDTVVEVSGGCPVSLVVYRSATRTGPPVWDQASDAACVASLFRLTIAAGETRQLEVTAPIADVVGHASAPSHYFFGAVVRPNGRTLALTAGDAELAP